MHVQMHTQTHKEKETGGGLGGGLAVSLLRNSLAKEVIAGHHISATWAGSY